MRRILCVALLLFSAIAPSARASAPSCDDATLSALVTGDVGVARCVSQALGGEALFSYLIPPACSTNHRCPVLYLLHGFGGDYTSMLGTPGHPTQYVKALAGDPSTQADDLDFILIAPDGRTVTGGSAPAGQESFWVDWNPRLRSNAPRFEEHITQELVGLVDRSFPTVDARDWRAIDGVSLGGFGSFKLAFQHPDLYANAGSISGALNILVAPGAQPIPPRSSLPGAPITPVYVHGPQVVTTPPGFPFGDPFGAFGDPAADEAYFRGNNPLDLAMNATGVPLRFFHNDAVSRDPARDMANPPSYAGAQALEAVVMPMNLEMVEALRQDGIGSTYELHPGLHSAPYWDPYIRAQLEWQWAGVSHAGAPQPMSVPSSFNYRSIRDDFGVWGWRVHNAGPRPQEFTTLWSANPNGVVVQGSGVITIETPPLAIAGGIVIGGGAHTMQAFPDGHALVTIDLSNSTNVADEHSGTSTTPSARVCFTRVNDTPPCG